MNNEFTKEKLSVMQKISKEIFTDKKLELNYTDLLLDQMTVRLSGYIHSNLAEKRTLVYYCNRPTFLDWLFGRRKKVEFELEVKDLHLIPPKSQDKTIRIYLPTLKS